MKKILEDIKKFKGNVLCIGVNESKILNELNKNKKINLYELKRKYNRKLFSKKKKFKISNDKTVSIKKFRSIFKKKSIEYVIIDLNNIFDYFKFIVSNSIYICNKRIYIYGDTKYFDSELLSSKFKRYTDCIETIKVDDTAYLIIVDCKNTKFSFIKEKFYLIIDTLQNIGDFISFFLAS